MRREPRERGKEVFGQGRLPKTTERTEERRGVEEVVSEASEVDLWEEAVDLEEVVPDL